MIHYVYISGQLLDTAGYQDNKHGFWLADNEFECHSQLYRDLETTPSRIKTVQRSWLQVSSAVELR